MLVVKVGDSIEKSLKQWKRKFESTKILRELRERTEYKKRSVKRRDTVSKAAHKEKIRKNSE